MRVYDVGSFFVPHTFAMDVNQMRCFSLMHDKIISNLCEPIKYLRLCVEARCIAFFKLNKCGRIDFGIVK